MIVYTAPAGVCDGEGVCVCVCVTLRVADMLGEMDAVCDAVGEAVGLCTDPVTVILYVVPSQLQSP